MSEVRDFRGCDPKESELNENQLFAIFCQISPKPNSLPSEGRHYFDSESTHSIFSILVMIIRLFFECITRTVVVIKSYIYFRFSIFFRFYFNFNALV